MYGGGKWALSSNFLENKAFSKEFLDRFSIIILLSGILKSLSCDATQLLYLKSVGNNLELPPEIRR